MKRFISIITVLCMFSSSVVFSAPEGVQENSSGKQTKVMVADNFDEFSDFSSQLIALDDSDSFSTGLTITAGKPVVSEKAEDNQQIERPPAEEVDGVIMAPLRAIAEEAGANAVYDSTAKNITVEKENTQIVITPKENTIQVDNEEVEVSKAPYIDNGNTMVPVTDIAESIGFEVEENNDGSIYLSRDYQTKRIIVKSTEDINEYYGAVSVIKGYDDLYILQYETEEEAKEAVSKYSANPSVEYAEPDKVVSLDIGEPDISDENGISEDYRDSGVKYIEIDEDFINSLSPEEAEFYRAAKEENTSVMENSSVFAAESSASGHKSWGADKMQVDTFNNNLEQSQSGKNLPEVIVGVLDTGIDSDHEFLKDRIIDNDKNYTTDTEYTNTNTKSSEDGHGHGTHVSGTIIDLTLDNVKVMPFKVMSDAGKGTDISVYNGMIAAINNDVDVINMSLGGKGKSSHEEAAVLKAYEAGIPVIVAAGNETDDASKYTPACINEAITVSALDSNGKFASFSNFGEKIDVSAPGVSINSAKRGGGYISADGTSMAAPHVSAAAAMLKSYQKDMSVKRIEEILKQSADDLGSAGWDKDFGEGMVNLGNAWENIDVESIPAPKFDRKGGEFTGSFELTLSCTDTDAKIYYTTDGTAPTEASNLYTSPITIDNSVAITAVAYKNGKKSAAKVEKFYLDGYDLDENYSLTSKSGKYYLYKYRGYLDTVKIPKTVKSGNKEREIVGIYSSAFSDSTSEKVIIPETITDVDSRAFMYSNINEIEVVNNHSIYSSKDGVLLSENNKNLVAYPPAKETTSYSIPNGTKRIEDNAFIYCTNLNYINIPASVEYIAEGNPFKYCNALYGINVNSENNNFCDVNGVLYSSNMKKLVMCPLNKLVNSNMLDHNKYSFNIPGNVVEIGAYALYGAKFLRYGISRSSIERITVPDSVTTIGDYAFYGCSLKNNLIIPKSVTTIGDYAFAYVDAPDIDFKGNITNLANGAFYYSNIKSVDLPNSLSSIGSHAFYRTKLESIVIPENVNTISYNAFYNSSSLKSAYFEGNAPASFGSGVFNSCAEDFMIYYYKGAEGFSSTNKKWKNYNITELDRNKIKTITFVYDDNVIETKSYHQGEIIGTLDNMPKVEGRIFDGWYKEEDLLNKFAANTPIDDTETITLYAKYVTFLDDSDFVVSDTGVITKYNGGKKDIFIPTILNGIKVKKIDSYVFSGKPIEILDIDEGITSIGYMSFVNCYNLTNINIPYVERLDNYCFAGCSNLEQIELPECLSYVQSGMFVNCRNLKNINVAKGNTKYTSDNGIVYNADRTEIIQYPTGKEDSEFTVPEGIEKIGDEAFRSCSNLENIILPQSLKKIGDWSFRDGNLAGLPFNPISSSAKDVCKIKSIVIPKNVTDIGTAAFNSISSLEKVYFEGDEPTEFSDSAFEGCANDFKIYYYEGTEWPGISGGYWNGYPIEMIPMGQTNPPTEESTMESTTEDATEAPTEETSYSDESDFEIDENGVITKYKGTAENVVIPPVIDRKNVTELGVYSFWGNKTIKTVIIPKSVVKISHHAFIYCENLISINVDDNNKNYADIDGVLFNKDKTLILIYPDGLKNTSYSIPSGVKSIGDATFDDCYNLTNIEIPDSVTYIGMAAFDDCKNLTNIEIPFGVKTIMNTTFWGCTSLTNVKIPNSVTTIRNAFENCDSLTSIEIPESVTSLWGGTNNTSFMRCKNLKNVYFKGNAPTGGTGIFYNCNPDLTLYYYEGATGFTTPTWNGYKTEMLTDKINTDITNVASVGSVPYTGEPIIGYTGTPKSNYTGEYEITYSGRNSTEYSGTTAPINVGDYIVKIKIPDGQRYKGEVSFDFSIVKSGTEFENLTVYNQDNVQTKKFIYGDKISVKAKPQATGTVADVGTLSFVPPKSKQMALFAGNKPISGATLPADDGVYTMTVDTRLDCFAIGENVISAKYVGDENMADYKEDVTVVINKKDVILAGVTAENAVYDGTAQKGYIGEPKSSLYTGEYDITYAGRNNTQYSGVEAPISVGDYTVTFTIPENEKYSGSLSVDFSILKQKTEFAGGLKVYNKDKQETNEFVYGDVITITAKPQVQAQAQTAGVMTFSTFGFAEPDEKEMALFMGDKQISGAVIPENGVYTMEVDSREDCFVIGRNTITAKYVGDEIMSDYEETAVITINEKDLVIGGVSAANEVYDGTAKKGYSGKPVSDLYKGEYKIMYTGRNGMDYNSDEAPTKAGDYTVTFTIPDGGKYTGSVSLDFSILKQEMKFDGGIKVYNKDNPEAKAFIYGDLLNVEVNPQITGNNSDKLALFVNDVQIPDVTCTDENDIYTLSVNTKNESFAIGENNIAVKYVGSDNISPYEEHAIIILNKKSTNIEGVKSVDNIAYNGMPQSGYYGEPKSNEYNYKDYDIIYVGRNSTTYDSKEAPIDVGDYSVVFTIPDDKKYTGSTSLDFSIVEAGKPEEDNTENSTETGIADSTESETETSSEQTTENSTEISTENTTESTEESSTETSTENTTESTEESSTETSTENTTESTKNPVKDKDALDIIFGNVDGDNILTVNDAVCVLQKVLDGNFKLPIEKNKNVDNYMQYADVDDNGILTAADAAAIIQKVLNNNFVFLAEK